MADSDKQGASRAMTEKSNADSNADHKSGQLLKPLAYPQYCGEKQGWKLKSLFPGSSSNSKDGARDPRERVPSKNLGARPWSCICLLRILYRTDERRTATGFLVGPGMVGTSAHVLYSPDPACGLASEIEVIPGYLQPQGHRLSQTCDVFRWNRNWGATASDFIAAFDYGVIKLPNPSLFGSFGRLLWCPPDRADLKAEFMLSGYPGEPPDKSFTVEPGENKKDYMQWWHKGRIVGTPGKQSVFHDIVTAPGQSGSPLFFLDKTDPKMLELFVIGIHSKASSDRPDTNVARLVTKDLIADYTRWAEQFGTSDLVA